MTRIRITALDVANLNKADHFTRDLAIKGPLAFTLRGHGHASHKHITGGAVAALCRASLQTGFHGIGTRSEMPHADTRLNVYGVRNLRAVGVAVFRMTIREKMRLSVGVGRRGRKGLRTGVRPVLGTGTSIRVTLLQRRRRRLTLASGLVNARRDSSAGLVPVPPELYIHGGR